MKATQSDRDDVDPLVVPAEAPGPRLVPAVALPPAQVDGDDERDVQADHRDRRPDGVADEVVPDRRDHEDGEKNDDAEDRPPRTRFRATRRQIW